MVRITWWEIYVSSIEKQGLVFSEWQIFCQYVRQMYIQGRIHRIRRWLLVNNLLNPLQTWAYRRESQAQVKTDTFLGEFTTGFGVVAIKK